MESSMAFFGLVMMGGIAILFTHVSNWLFRLASEEDEPYIFIAGMITQAISIILIIWMVNNTILIHTS